MADVGEITGREIGPNRDADHDSMLIQSVETDDDDVQTVQLGLPPGMDANPVDGGDIFSVEIGKNWKVSFCVDDKSAPDSSLGQGEIEIYSLSGGQRKAKIRLGVDESVKVEGASFKLLSDVDNAVRFSELQSAFDTLRDDFNTLVSKFNAHTHVTSGLAGAVPVAGTAAPTPTPGTPSSASVSLAKIDEITVP
jgi:hypothetical protein